MNALSSTQLSKQCKIDHRSLCFVILYGFCYFHIVLQSSLLVNREEEQTRLAESPEFEMIRLRVFLMKYKEHLDKFGMLYFSQLFVNPH